LVGGRHRNRQVRTTAHAQQRQQDGGAQSEPVAPSEGVDGAQDGRDDSQVDAQLRDKLALQLL
jgi:hypothetical protein